MKTRTGHVAAVKWPGVSSWLVKVNGVKAGVVRMDDTGVFIAVAGHNKLGRFDTKVKAVNAIAEAVQ